MMHCITPSLFLRRTYSRAGCLSNMKFIVQLAALAGILTLSSCGSQQPKNLSASHWVGTWSTGSQLVEPRNLPPEPGLTNNTLRQVVHVSIGGKLLRLRFSNEFSTQPVTMQSVHIARQTSDSAIDPDSDRQLSFQGKAGVTMAPGTASYSDTVEFNLPPGSNLSITIYFGQTSADVTGHPGSRTTSFLLPGNALNNVDFAQAIGTDHWYVISDVEVAKPTSTKAIAVLGDSITDGRGSGTNKQNRWPDELAKRLRENPSSRNIAVLNEGIGGNCVLRACLGPAGLDRFERDVLDQAGVRWLIILEGINDIGQVKGDAQASQVARDLIAAYEQMIDRAHAKGILVYGATMLPFATSFYDAPERQDAWRKVNDWIRNSGRFDGVIDLADALKDSQHPTRLLPLADSGDHLHPSEAGHRLMAEAVDLNLFKND